MRSLIDTSALLALGHARDQYHSRAVTIARRHRAAGVTFLGTTLVLAEFHAHLLYLRGSADARAAVSRLTSDPLHEWVAVDAELVDSATTSWLERYDDQPFTLTDAVSFEVMRRHRVTHAFAFDRHFEVAGFELLR